MPGQESGVKVYGEQRGAAVGDFNEDGRSDLVLTQNSGETILLQNTRGRPGLRVRLKGTPGNPCGVGAVLRFQYENRMGPAREIHAGSGYGSQDSALQVMALEGRPKRIWVRWPGGKVTEHDLPAGAQEIAVELNGPVKRLK